MVREGSVCYVCSCILISFWWMLCGLIMIAKSQRFQGFRPGTIPPHLLPTYYMFSMDECARETTLEAMEQNNM